MIWGFQFLLVIPFITSGYSIEILLDSVSRIWNISAHISSVHHSVGRHRKPETFAALEDTKLG